MGSHHDESMQRATKVSVKGDFSGARLSALGFEHRFYSKGDTFWVETQGEEGVAKSYQVLYTFGTEPLQQYLVATEKGRLQALPLAWDTERSLWFHLQEDLKPKTGEWIHWTGGGMNWNSMCADCHSTGLKKNYVPADDRYETSWQALDVGCEACHGPGAAHVKQAQAGTTINRALLDMIRGETSQKTVEKCGRCHARREQLTPAFEHGGHSMLNHYLPDPLSQGLYHSDGQIDQEVFVYGSFTQSRMYQLGVTCTHCHDPHSAKVKREGNALCLGCHAAQYATPAHHHHSPDGASRENTAYDRGTGDQCVDCHMPGKVYMTNDFRRDHSLRVPRPDLSAKFGTPNACNNCHGDRSPEWAAEQVRLWFGDTRAPHYSDTLTRAAVDPLGTRQALITLLQDPAQPHIARAATVQYLAQLMPTDPAVRQALLHGLDDSNALIRATIARAMYDLPLEQKLPDLLQLLDDPVTAVRIAAARSLVELKPNSPAWHTLNRDTHNLLAKAAEEYQTQLTVNSDFAASHIQQGTDALKSGREEDAARHFVRALEIDDHQNAARMSLAQLRYRQGDITAAESLYRKVISQEPDAAAPHYALGLLLAELGQLTAAETELEAAARLGANPRAWYNLAVLRHQQGRADAEKAYLQALELSPGNPEFTQGLASFYVQNKQWRKARTLIKQSLSVNPNHPLLLRLRQFLAQAPQT
ncbi:tetratricopeptide repeat protein [Microbulbifer thermotolerans]|nr:tetratricopeptide repeat protein [Microbulbifer thermotolerans]